MVGPESPTVNVLTVQEQHQSQLMQDFPLTKLQFESCTVNEDSAGPLSGRKCLGLRFSHESHTSHDYAGPRLRAAINWWMQVASCISGIKSGANSECKLPSIAS
jgi:hypothetical protein